jgi:hypothetical protein
MMRVSLEPGRLLTGATVSSAWPLWCLFGGLLLELRTQGHPVGFALFAVGVPAAVGVFVALQRRAIGAYAEPFMGRGLWQVALAAIAALIATRVPLGRSTLQVVAGFGAGFALAASILHLRIAESVAGWTTGPLEVDDVGRARLRGSDATYVLDEVPCGLLAGDALTLPEVRVAEPTAAGPYRQGRVRGFAPYVLALDARSAVAGLRVRAVLLAAWCGVSACVALGWI